MGPKIGGIQVHAAEVSGFPAFSLAEARLRTKLDGIVKCFPRRSQGNGVLGANDKYDPDFVFQALYLAAQGRLRQVQLVCGPAKTSMRGHGGKTSQMTKFHTRQLRY